MKAILTNREKIIVKEVIAGKTSREIAEDLCLSIETVKWYRKRLLHQFEAKNFAALVSILKEQELV